MNGILLTQDSGKILGPVSKLLGLIMNGIFELLNFIGIPNIGLSIILFTIVVYLLMLPLTIKQQKFSKLSAKMNPELQAIQAKYKNRKDNESAMQMNAETQAVYAKYGVSPTGSCLPLLVQMPILFALYRVISNIPAYVNKVKDAFGVLADKIIEKGLVEEVQAFQEAAMYAKNFDKNERNAIIDVLNKMNSSDLFAFAQENGFETLQLGEDFILSQTSGVTGLLDKYNIFLGLNMGNSPQSIIKEAWAAGAWLLVVAAILVPVLSCLTQWLNTKLAPGQQRNKDGNSGNEMADTMASSMKTMNVIMPLMSAWLCFTLPTGMGLYWIAGAVVRIIQQIIINKHIDKMDLDKVIEKNKEKSAKKMAKYEANQARLQEYANMNTRNISGNAGRSYADKAKTATQKAENTSANVNTSSAKPGSLMAKANMVKDYNERNNK